MYTAASSEAADVGAARRAADFQLGWFASPLFGEQGDYPASMRSGAGTSLPTFTSQEVEMNRGKVASWQQLKTITR